LLKPLNREVEWKSVTTIYELRKQVQPFQSNYAALEILYRSCDRFTKARWRNDYELTAFVATM